MKQNENISSKIYKYYCRLQATRRARNVIFLKASKIIQTVIKINKAQVF